MPYRPRSLRVVVHISEGSSFFFLSQLVTPQFLDLQRRVTIPDSNDRLTDHYFKGLPMSTFSPAVELRPCNFTSSTLKNWIVTLDDYWSPSFWKTSSHSTCLVGTSNIVHWVDPFVRSSPPSFNRWDMITPDFSPIDAISVSPPPTLTAATSAELVFADSPLFLSPDSCYKFYTDGSLINLGSPEVSMGWSWV
ncbi:unnamed protein product [Rhizophagus irregularis]|nr:unnamed protein product [Rhizophagus irregularis]